MRIVGHGVDLVRVPRVADLIERHGLRFLNRIYTQREQAYADARPKRRVEHLAARFAAKEAILKALGTGLSGGISWTEAEVINEPSGRPTVQLHGKALVVAEGLGISTWHISLSHTSDNALASAIAEGVAPYTGLD